MYQNIPAELQALPQFVNWRYELPPGKDKPTKVPYDPRTGWGAKSTDRSTWVSFDHAVSSIAPHYSGIGFVLSNEDPYCFIDLDTYDPKLTQEDKDRHAKILHAFQGYAELSPSGQGMHLIVKASVAAGRKRNGIEIYSADRYMTMTGNVWRPGPIVEQQELVNQLWAELGDTKEIITSTIDLPQTAEDKEICDKAYFAINGEKFKALYTGQWQSMYASQSEADFALIDILAYYSKNREQIIRIFQSSALGQRDKAKSKYHNDRMLNRAFDNMPPEIDFTALRNRVETLLVEQAAPAPIEPPPPTEDVYSLPPGLLGDIAQFIYSAAPRQVPEIALCGAIGLMAGICGRSYNIGGTGLNQYLLLLAPTGSGKEGIASGISALMNEVQKQVPAALDFIGPGEIRSDAALLKYISKKSPSFLTVGGEFGHTMRQMAAVNAQSNILAIKKVMLDLYGKSGQGSVLRPTIYSDSDKNTMALQAPAFSFLGESAPESFFSAVDEALVSDGLLPRFTLIEYTGKQPALNQNRNHAPSSNLVQQLSAVCANSLMLNAAGKCINIQFETAAKEALDEFEEFARDKINANDNREVTRHIWNRAHLRALKLAGTIAVGVHPFEPVVALAHARWAINLSAHNTQKLVDRFATGEVGSYSTDDKHVREVTRVIKDFLYKPWKDVSSYCDFEVLHTNKIVPMQYISRRLIATSAFRLHRMGATNAMNTALKSMCDNGILVEMTKIEMHAKYAITPRGFAIATPKAFM